MPEVSRPATLEDLKILARALNEQGARYLLIGGWALFAHGLQRATVDVDLLVPPGARSAEALRQALLVMPDRAARDIDPAWFEEGETIRVADAFVVDLMFKACGETYDSLLPYAKTIELDGVPIVTVTLEGLLRTKQSYREKDALDRVAIERVLAGLGENLEDSD